MPRFWLYLGVACWWAAASGCAMRQIEGIWEGPLLEIAGSNPCRIRLQSGGALDFQCRGSVTFEGAGSYSLDRGVLQIQITHVAENGRGSRVEFPMRRYKVSGPGNQITLSPEHGDRALVWKRAVP